MKRIFRSMVAGALAIPLFVAGNAAAQGDVIDQNKVGAALATLVITDDDTDTYTSTIVTNTSATDEIVLAGEVISGDPNDNWTGQSFRCPMSPGETTQFVFSPVDAETSELTYECSIPGANEFSDPADLSQAKTMQINAAKGIMWLSIEGASFPNPTLSKNVLEGKSVVLNYSDGKAYEVGAVPFQAPSPEAQDFDTAYEFDGQEYARFPESLTASFHAPVEDLIKATLILFTLDGRLSSHHTPNAEAVVYFFNDDEEFHNTSLYFDCFAMLDLEDIDSRFLKDNLGSQVGHLQIIPQSVDPNDENHDGRFGNDDNARFMGILGWIVQEMHPNAELMDAHGNVIDTVGNNRGKAWGSLLTTSMTPLPNESGDVPALTR